MAPRTTASVLLALAVLGAGVGAVDSAIGDDWDLFVLFVVTGALVVASLASTRLARPAITLRRDLHRWLSEEAQTTGEPVERLLDRTVAARRSAFDAGPDDTARRAR